LYFIPMATNTTFIPATCDPVVLIVHHFIIQMPSVLPACVAAAIIGWTSAYLIRSRFANAKGSTTYFVSFFLFGFMMTDAGLLHCFNQDFPQSIDNSLNWLDGCFSSAVALSWLWNGLADSGIINDSKIRPRLAMAASYVLLFWVWYQHYWFDRFPQFNITGVLYYLLIAVGCGSYVILEAYTVITEKNFRGVGYLLFAGFFGLLGEGASRNPNANDFLCIISPLLSIELIWCICSDLAMLCVFFFFALNHSAPTNGSSNDRLSANFVALASEPGEAEKTHSDTI